MSLGPAARAAYRTFSTRPTAVLPFYVAALAAPVAGQAVVIAGVVLAYASLAGTGRLGAVYALLEEAGPIPIDDPEAIQSGNQALEDALVELFTPTVLAIVALSVLAALGVGAVVNAFTGAGQLHAVYASVTGGSGTRAGVGGAFRHWATFLALAVLELLAVVAGFVLVSVVVGVATLLTPLIGVPVGLGLLLPWIGATILLRLTFAFARPVAVVDDVGTVEALRSSFGYVTSEPFESFGYGILAVVGLAAVGVVAGIFGFLGAPTVGSLLSGLALFPFLDLLKTVLYEDEWTLALPPTPGAPATQRLRGALQAGLVELGAFARGNPASVLASVALFAVGIVAGLRAGGQVDAVFVASIESRLAEVNPVGSLFEYAANNWTVAAGGAFSGLAFGVPAAAMLLFNGLNIGLLYAIEADPAILLAFVLPHGIFEIPALVLAGALGLHLGVVATRYAAGSIDRPRLTAEVDRAFRAVIGLAVLLLVAALIEALVSPYYWRLLSI